MTLRPLLKRPARSPNRAVPFLGFEFEMGLFPNVLDEARGKGIDIALKYIPAERKS